MRVTGFEQRLTGKCESFYATNVCSLVLRPNEGQMTYSRTSILWEAIFQSFQEFVSTGKDRDAERAIRTLNISQKNTKSK